MVEREGIKREVETEREVYRYRDRKREGVEREVERQ